MFRSPKLLKKVFPLRLWGITSSKQVVYLTFDDGPIPEVTPWLLDFLKEKGIKATFFCVGDNVVRYPELYQRILTDGHQVGNHTMKHQNGMKTPQEEYLASIDEASKVIDSHLFRPPYGRLDRRLDKALSKRFKIVMWTWLSKDYSVSIPPSKIIAAANRIKAGDILVFHDNQKTAHRLQEILPPIVELLLAKKMTFSVIE
jgi:peptidoglycan-N-acetylglucosamine deacetylase